MATTQDLVKGIDVTALTSVSGSEINQSIDAGRLAEDKGMRIVTTDTAIGVPDVPDPNLADGMGIIPTWWSRYKWVRLPYATDPDAKVKEYNWDETKANDATLLKWQYTNADAEQALEDAAAAEALATTADANATIAKNDATNALTQTQNNQQDIETIQAEQTSQNNDIDALQELVESLLWKTGDLKTTANSTEYLTTEDQGWLRCDGSAVSRALFADLYEEIGDTFGAGDGETTFNVPNFEDKIMIGAGGSYTLGQNVGFATKTLGVSNLPDHAHKTTVPYITMNGGGVIGLGNSSDPKIGDQIYKSGSPVNPDGSNPGALAQPFSLLQPSVGVYVLIKT